MRKVNFKNLGIDVKIMLKCIIQEHDLFVWTEFKSFMVRTNGGP